MFGFGANRNTAHRFEPQVFCRSDRQGHTWWDIHHPVTGRITRVATEDEARICIEKNQY